jgi:3-phenylpropionate/trans-cinnamate dioxygenase ferredoxin subunit
MASCEERELEIMVANVGGRLYAAQNRCGHMNMPLARGTLEGPIVTCCLHGARFDITTGQVVSPAPERLMTIKGRDESPPVPQPKTRRLAVYPVKVDGGAVWVEAPERTV